MYDLIEGDEIIDGGAEFDGGDDVGYDEIVAGDDVVGATLRRATSQLALRGIQPTQRNVLTLAAKTLQAQAATKAKVQAMAAKNAIGIRPMAFNKSQVLPAPFDSNGTVGAGASVTINITAPVLWKPERLFIPSSIASNFTLDRLQVGLQNWLLTASSVPCEAFTEEATDNILRLDTLQIGQMLTAVFTNRSGGALTLRGMWKGFVAF